MKNICIVFVVIPVENKLVFKSVFNSKFIDYRKTSKIISNNEFSRSHSLNKAFTSCIFFCSFFTDNQRICVITFWTFNIIKTSCIFCQFFLRIEFYIYRFKYLISRKRCSLFLQEIWIIYTKAFELCFIAETDSCIKIFFRFIISFYINCCFTDNPSLINCNWSFRTDFFRNISCIRLNFIYILNASVDWRICIRSWISRNIFYRVNLCKNSVSCVVFTFFFSWNNKVESMRFISFISKRNIYIIRKNPCKFNFICKLTLRNLKLFRSCWNKATGCFFINQIALFHIILIRLKISLNLKTIICFWRKTFNNSFCWIFFWTGWTYNSLQIFRISKNFINDIFFVSFRRTVTHPPVDFCTKSIWVWNNWCNKRSCHCWTKGNITVLRSWFYIVFSNNLKVSVYTGFCFEFKKIVSCFTRFFEFWKRTFCWKDFIFYSTFNRFPLKRNCAFLSMGSC